MQRGQPAIDDAEGGGLEIDHPAIAGNRSSGAALSHLVENGQQCAQLIHFLNDNDVQQTVVEPGLWGNGEMIAELVGVGNTDKKSFGMEMLSGGWEIDVEGPAFTREKMSEGDLDIGLQASCRLLCESMRYLCVKADAA